MGRIKYKVPPPLPRRTNESQNRSNPSVSLETVITFTLRRNKIFIKISEKEVALGLNKFIRRFSLFPGIEICNFFCFRRDIRVVYDDLYVSLSFLHPPFAVHPVHSFSFTVWVDPNLPRARRKTDDPFLITARTQRFTPHSPFSVIVFIFMRGYRG